MKKINKKDFIDAFKEGALMYGMFVVIFLIPLGLIQFISDEFIFINFVFFAIKAIFITMIVGGLYGIIEKILL